MPVSIGDTICVKSADIDAGKASPIKIEWKQSFQTQTADFIEAPFTIVTSKDPAGKTGADTESVLFIQVSKLADFEKKQVEGKGQFTIVIDSDFQYGQKSKDGTGRWLAFQNKKNNMFQHRFIQSLMAKGGDKVGDMAKQLGYDGVQSLVGALSDVIGHSLHNFES